MLKVLSGSAAQARQASDANRSTGVTGEALIPLDGTAVVGVPTGISTVAYPAQSRGHADRGWQRGKEEEVIQAVIFDMDGLLVDSEPVWDRARRSMADRAGKSWTEDDHRAVMGVSTREWADYMIDRLELSLAPQAVVDQIIERMVEMYRTGIPWFPGALDAVNLAARHFKTALASGSHPTLVDAVTADAAVQGKFQVIVSADEVGAGKPAPDVYLAAAARLGVEPASCICLEDSANGILAGVRAGMQVIAVPDSRFPPGKAALDQAHLVLPSLAALSVEKLTQLGVS